MAVVNSESFVTYTILSLFITILDTIQNLMGETMCKLFVLTKIPTL